MGKSISKILVPTDFSKSSEMAMRYAVTLARESSAEILILHVCSSDVPPEPAYRFPLQRVSRSEKERQAREMMQEFTEKFQLPEVRAESQVVHGKPHEEINKAARYSGVDLIVMGTHGYTGLRHAALGSVAERTLRESPCPVLVVKTSGKQFIQG